MGGRSFKFFADNDDLEELITAMRNIEGLTYVEVQSRLNQDNRVSDDALDVLEYALPTNDSPRRRPRCLVVPLKEELVRRPIELADGSGQITVIDQGFNWNSVALALGGEVRPKIVIQSDINTVGDTPTALSIHSQIKNLAKSMCENVGEKGQPVWIMNGAREKGQSDWRLVDQIDQSKADDVDITRPNS